MFFKSTKSQTTLNPDDILDFKIFEPEFPDTYKQEKEKSALFSKYIKFENLSIDEKLKRYDDFVKKLPKNIEDYTKARYSQFYRDFKKEAFQFFKDFQGTFQHYYHDERNIDFNDGPDEKEISFILVLILKNEIIPCLCTKINCSPEIQADLSTNSEIYWLNLKSKKSEYCLPHFSFLTSLNDLKNALIFMKKPKKQEIVQNLNLYLFYQFGKKYTSQLSQEKIFLWYRPNYNQEILTKQMFTIMLRSSKNNTLLDKSTFLKEDFIQLLSWQDYEDFYSLIESIIILKNHKNPKTTWNTLSYLENHRLKNLFEIYENPLNPQYSSLSSHRIIETIKICKSPDCLKILKEKFLKS